MKKKVAVSIFLDCSLSNVFYIQTYKQEIKYKYLSILINSYERFF